MKNTTYTSPSELAPFDLGWLCGIIDGEGCFVSRLKPNKSGTPSIVDLSVQVASTDLDLIDRLTELVGGRYYGPRHKAGCKPCWSWRIYKRHEVADFCQNIRPHMCARRQERIDELLAVYDQYARKD